MNKKREKLYHDYRALTVEMGYVPIGKQRFNGIMNTVADIPDFMEFFKPLGKVKQKTPNLKQTTKREVEKNWETPLPLIWPHKIYIPCNSKGEIDWNSAPIFYPKELEGCTHYKIIPDKPNGLTVDDLLDIQSLISFTPATADRVNVYKSGEIHGFCTPKVYEEYKFAVDKCRRCGKPKGSSDYINCTVPECNQKLTILPI